MAAPNVRNWIFDLGNVLLRWAPEPVVAEVFPESEDHSALTKAIFHHPCWQSYDAGHISEQEACHSVATHIEQPFERVQALIMGCQNSLVAIEESVAFLQQLKAQGYRLFCLSNMPIEFYARLREMHDFWDCFDHITISGHVNYIKPQPEIYHYVLEHNRLKAEECVFLDDLAVNVAAAEALGIHAVQFTSIQECLPILTQRQLYVAN